MVKPNMAHQMGRFAVGIGDQVTADRRHRHLDAVELAEGASVSSPGPASGAVRFGEVWDHLDRGSNAAWPSRPQRNTTRGGLAQGVIPHGLVQVVPHLLPDLP